MARPNPRRLSCPALVATATVATMFLAGCHASSVGLAPPTTTVPTTPDSSVAPPPPAIAPSTSAPVTTTTTTVHAPTIIVAPATTAAPPVTPGFPQSGSSGPAVLQLQQSLNALGYWLGTPDGKFGPTTQQAVWALQKAAGLPRSGVVDAATAAALAAGTKPTARSTSGHVIEVDLAKQLVLFVTNGHVDSALNTSTGGGYVFYDQGTRNVAITPSGHFATYRQIDGPHMSSLGLLFRPKYFTGGFAIHGDSYVPPRPVSHGCVRVSNEAINWIWANGSDPIGTPVWVY